MMSPFSIHIHDWDLEYYDGPKSVIRLQIGCGRQYACFPMCQFLLFAVVNTEKIR